MQPVSHLYQSPWHENINEPHFTLSGSTTVTSRSSHAFTYCMREKNTATVPFFLALCFHQLLHCVIFHSPTACGCCFFLPRINRGIITILPRWCGHLTPHARPWTSRSSIKTHQMERQGQHQEEYPQIEVTWVVEFILVRVVVPAPGQGCPDPLTEGLHNLWAHLPSSPLLSAQVGLADGDDDDDAGAARLQWNDLLYLIMHATVATPPCWRDAAWLLSLSFHGSVFLSVVLSSAVSHPSVDACIAAAAAAAVLIMFVSILPLSPLRLACTDAQLWPPPPFCLFHSSSLHIHPCPLCEFHLQSNTLRHAIKPRCALHTMYL